MHLSLFEQGEVFRLAFIFGIGLGIFYDLFRLIRAMGFTNQRSIFFQDLLFMSCCSVLCFFFSQAFLHGHFRVYSAFAQILGFVSYRITAGTLTGYIYKCVGSIYQKLTSLFEHITVTFGCILHKTYLTVLANCIKISKEMRKYSEK